MRRLLLLSAFWAGVLFAASAQGPSPGAFQVALRAFYPQRKAAGRVTGKTSDATLVTYGVGGADGDFEVLSDLYVTAYGGGQTIVQVTYRDETNVSQTVTLGSALMSGPIAVSSLVFRAKANTTITVATTGTALLTYNASAVVVQVQ